MTVADYIAREIVRQGTDTVFGYPGARNIALMESVYNEEGLRFVNVYHEHTAAFAACGYAQIGGRLGVAMSTSGPGGTNMLTGIAQAYCDSLPVLFITGQAATHALRGAAKIRNRVSQEVNIVAMATPVTKYAVQIRDGKDLPHELEKAMGIAVKGRPGPVLLDLPEDLQFAEIDPDAVTFSSLETAPYGVTQEELSRLSGLIAESRRPVVALGNGAHWFGGELESAFPSVPVVASLSAPDVYPNERPLYLGVCGNYGLRCANFALSNADLIIALGFTMSKRYTGNDLDRFAPEAKVVRVDIDEEELLDRNVKTDELKIHCDLRSFFDTAGDVLSGLSPEEGWSSRCDMWKREYYTESSELEPYGYYYAMNRLRRDDDIIALDVGNHQMWALQSLSFAHGQRLASSSGLSTMGYGLPAAIGAYYADPTADTVCICGDGGLQMMLPEFELLRRERLPITVIVMNDASLGMIRMLQDTYYGGNHAGSVQDYSAPDFASVARAYGLRSCVAESVPEFEKQFARRGGEPLVVEVRLHEECDVRPRIISKKPIWDMYPFLPEDEIGKNMVVPYGGASHE